MLDKAILEQDLSFPFMITKKIYDFSLFFKDLTEHFRKILKEKLNPSNSIYTKASTNYTQDQCLHIMDLLFNAMQYPQEKISTELFLLKIIQSKNRISPQSLIKRLEELKKTSIAEPPKENKPQEFSKKDSLEEEEEKLPFKKSDLVEVPFSMQEKKFSSKQDALLNFTNVEFDGILQKN